MKMIDHLPKYVVKIIMVLEIIILVTQIILPRTSIYFRYWFYYPKFGNYLNVNDVVMVSGEQFHLYVRDINQRYTYSSTDFKVAFADAFGNVEAYKPGTAFIKVKLSDDTLICRVKVIRLNCKSVTLSVGETKKLNVIGNWFFESYSSDHPEVAMVSKHGKVTAVGPGTAIVTVKAKGKKMKCQVTVSDKL